MHYNRFYRGSCFNIALAPLYTCLYLFTLVGLLLLATPAAAASTIYCVATTSVPTTAPCANPTTYTNIQSAVDAASTGDEIRIAAGTYTQPNGTYVIMILDKSLTFRGGYTTTNWQSQNATTATIIDGENQRPVVQVHGSEATFERLTITRGRNAGSNGGGIDANIFPSSGPGVKLIDVSIVNNSSAGSGGGLFIVGGSTSLIRTDIRNNTAGEDGGGFFGLSLTATESTIAQNTASRNAGGAAVLYGSFISSRITGNTATSGDGGGIHLHPSQIGETVAITQTAIVGNTAGTRGGGMYLGGIAGAQVRWSLLANNHAVHGDAFVVDPSSLALAQVSLQNVTIARTGGASGEAIQLGVLNPSAPISLSLNNTVVTSHTVAIVRQSNATISGDYNAFFGNGTNQLVDGTSTPLPFAHLIGADPLFANSAASDFHLHSTSPLRDAANPGFNYAGQHDLDGVAVPIGAAADIGAYEYILRNRFVNLPLIRR